MRCSGWSSLAISVCSALALAAPAAAHITAVPPFIAANDSATVSLSGPNERGVAMIRFDVTVPSEFRIVHAHPADGWESRVRGSTATWTEGSLAPGAEATFKLELEAPAEPGPATIEISQRYPGGDVVTWGVGLTVTPASEAPSQNLGWALVTALVGLIVLAAVGVAFLRRTRSLQER